MPYRSFLSLLSVSALSVVISFGCKAPLRNGTGAGGSSSPGTGGSGMATGLGGSDSGGTNGSGMGGGGGDIVILTGMGGSSTGGDSGGDGSAGATGNSGGSTGTGGGGTGTGGAPVKMACGAATSDPLPYTSGYTADPTNHSNAMSIASAMTSDEKAQQMSGLPQSGTANFNVFNQETNSNRGIRGFYYRDGPRGVNLNATGDNQGDFSTAFPVAIARAAAFDPDLEYQVGEAIGDEMLASGNTMLLAPTVNILRHPAWGRAQETYGEDVFLLGRLGSAFVAGVQQYTGACAKHYAANNIEDGRETANATMDEETLREIYARHFEMIVKEGGRLLDHGLLQRGERHACDAERAPFDRPSADRLWIPGLRPFRLVGDAERQQRPVSGGQHAPTDRAAGGQRGTRYGAPLALQLLDPQLAGDVGRIAGDAALDLDGPHPRAEVSLPHRQDERVRAEDAVHHLLRRQHLGE